MAKKDPNEILESVSTSRRKFIKKSVKAGFSLPVVATFTMSGLMATPASAQSNSS